MRRFGRRMFLSGAAGFTLAIPFLPSLLKNEAHAAPSGGKAKRFVAFATDHGGIWQPSMYPADAVLTASQSYAGHDIRRGSLPLDVSGGKAAISPVLSGSSDVLTSALAGKINLLRGLDVPFYLAHHRGGHLGNYSNNDANGLDGATVQGSPRATIDQLMAWSSSFYPDLGSIKERFLVIGGQGMSASWSSPSTHSGQIQNVDPENDSLALFNKIFVPPPENTTPRPLIVDHVIEDYQRLRNGSRRLSAADKQRLDDHLDRLDELQRKLNVQVDCGNVEVPTHSSTDEWQSSSYSIDPAAQKRFWQLMNDVIAAAFACDTSRIATLRIDDIFSSYVGDWHQDVAHQAAMPDGVRQAVIETAHQLFFEDVFLDLASKLDAIQEEEGTALDASLLQWTHECGCATHDPIELPVITAGSAGGYFVTGQYADYRNMTKQAHTPSGDSAVTSHVGLIYNQWLGTVLQSMGLDPSEYEDGVNGGYGVLQISTETWWAGYGKYGADETSVMGEVLPFLKA